MKKIITLFFLILSAQAVYSQRNTSGVNRYADVDRKAMQIPERSTKNARMIAEHIMSEFDKEEDRLRAAFIWVASNIDYDVRNIRKPIYTERREMIDKALSTRKALCGGYSALFCELCIEMGIKCYEIDGYTINRGDISDIGHVWCAVRTEGEWRLFEPTWAAGFISEGKFIRRINNAYYKVLPSVFIITHMPYDYLWQFLYHPVTTAEFTSGNTQENISRLYFNYQDSIKVYELQSPLERLIASESRIMSNGVTNGLITEKLKVVRHNIGYEKSVIAVDFYNDAVMDFNTAIDLMNEFITYWNKRFKPAKSDDDIRNMLSGVSGKLEQAKEKLSLAEGAGAPEINTSGMSPKQFETEIRGLENRLMIVQDWLETYLKKGKLGRNAMFSGYYGNPFN